MILRNSSHFGDDLSLHLSCEADGMAQVNHLQQFWAFRMGAQQRSIATRPGQRLQKTMGNHHAIHGTFHYFDWAIFYVAFCMFTRG